MRTLIHYSTPELRDGDGGAGPIKVEGLQHHSISLLMSALWAHRGWPIPPPKKHQTWLTPQRVSLFPCEQSDIWRWGWEGKLNGKRVRHVNVRQRQRVCDGWDTCWDRDRKETQHWWETAVLTQGGSVYDITVGTVVNIDIHSMMLFYLHTARDGQEMQSEQVHTSFSIFKHNRFEEAL